MVVIMVSKTNLNNINSFKELYSIAEKVEENISFGGSRFIHIRGFEGKLPIYALSKRMLEIVRIIKLKRDVILDKTEYEFEKKLTAKINVIYENNDKRTKNKNPLTQLFCALRDYWQHLKIMGTGIVLNGMVIVLLILLTFSLTLELLNMLLMIRKKLFQRYLILISQLSRPGLEN